MKLSKLWNTYSYPNIVPQIELLIKSDYMYMYSEIIKYKSWVL